MPRPTLLAALTAALLVQAAAVAPAAAQDQAAGDLAGEPVPMETRMWIAAKMLSAVETHFAHWEGAPDLDLEAVFRTYAKEAVEAPDRRAFSLASMAFLARLRNGHTGFRDDWLRGTAGASLGFSLTETDEGWVVERSRLEGLEVGRRVLAIDGRPVEEVLAEVLPYVSASSQREARRKAWFQGALVWPLRFTLELDGGEAFQVRRGDQELLPPASRSFEKRVLEGGVAYVRIPSFGNPGMEEAAVAFVEENAGAPAMVVDVRGNGGGTTPTRLIRVLMDRPYRGFGQSTAFDVGLYSAYQRISEMVPPGALDDYTRGYVEAFVEFERPRMVFDGRVEEPGTPLFTGPLVILADDGCASACEDFILPFTSSGRATILGEPTSGSTGQPYLWDFGNGMSFRVSARRVVMPDGSRFEGAGIVPDREIRPTAEDLRTGRDPVLERALELLAGSG